jgi:hypothetical protein
MPLEERPPLDEADRAQAPRKLPYTPPSVTRVPLRPEEAVLGGCKSTTSAGPNNAACVIGLSQCSTPAS